jgi:hypothetical protein
MGRVLATLFFGAVGASVGLAAVWYAGVIGGFVVVLLAAAFLVIDPWAPQPQDMGGDE